MHLNNHFLIHLVKELKPKLLGTKLASCYSQNRDELIFSFDGGSDTFFLRALLSGAFTCLTFPKEHARAKRNSVDLFEEIIGKAVMDISVVTNDRSFIIHLSENYVLLFKLHGNRSNIILYHQESFHSMFNNRLKNDEGIVPSDIAKPDEIDFEKWLASPDLKKHFPTFGLRVGDELKRQGFEGVPPNEQWQLIEKVRSAMNDSLFHIAIDDKGVPYLTLFKTDNSLSTHSSALEGCNALSKYYHQTYLFDQEKNRYKQLIQTAIKKTSAYIKNTQKKLGALETKRPYDEIANIIMANLHVIPDKAESVILTDFYTNSPIEIKLKMNTSPQKLAEQYYRKCKNQSKERENLQQNLRSKGEELKSLQSLNSTLVDISDRRQLRQFVNLNLADQVSKQEEKRLPYYQQEIDGFEVRIGKSSKDNDLMIRQYAHKDDIWLHARDVPGSHVLIRHQKNRKVNEEVIEKVAQLAAHYSKRKHDSLAPVIYTPRKFVRKSKNLAPGQVLVDKENVILVKPSKTPSL